MRNNIKRLIAGIGLASLILATSVGCSRFNPDEVQAKLYTHGDYVSKAHSSGLVDYKYKMIENGDKKLAYITGGYDHQREMNEMYNDRLNDSKRHPDRPTPLIINVVTLKDNGKYDVIQIFDDVEVCTTPFLLCTGYGFYGKLGLNESKKDKAYLFKDVKNMIDPASESTGTPIPLDDKMKRLYNEALRTLESYY